MWITMKFQCLEGIQDMLFNISYHNFNAFFCSNWTVPICSHPYKDHCTLQWMGLNLYSRGFFHPQTSHFWGVRILRTDVFVCRRGSFTLWSLDIMFMAKGTPPDSPWGFTKKNMVHSQKDVQLQAKNSPSSSNLAVHIHKNSCIR